jgi:aldehyde:ferredoxin oxidoreductase
MGWKLTHEDLNSIGLEILRSKYQFKVREGFDYEKIRIPKRSLETPTPLGVVGEDYLRAGVRAYINHLEEKIETVELRAPRN